MNKFFTALCQLIGLIIVIIALVIATFIGMSYYRPAFAQYGPSDTARVLTSEQTTPNYHRTFQLSTHTGASVDPEPYDEQEAERLARIEWIERNGDIPPAPSQADLDYMQGYAQQLQAQYDKGKK